MAGPEAFDVVVVGAGPAGSAAAAAAAAGGARVALLDRSRFPRYKTCGGGLIGPSLAALPRGFPVRAAIREASFTLAGSRPVLRSSDDPIIRTATRAELDDWLARQAVAAGAEFRNPCAVRAAEVGEDEVLLDTDEGSLTSRVVVAADGASGRLSRLVGVTTSQVDLGLEVELAAGPRADEWAERIHLDWGPIPGSYAWVFPKGDTLTVGVIAGRGRPDETRRYLADFLAQQRMTGLRVVHESGHLTRCRTPESPIARGRLLVAGDAAGLLEPWTREGISFALRSGRIAGEVAARAALADEDPETLGTTYAELLAVDLVPEMTAGARCLAAFERRPGAFHWLIGRTAPGWDGFRRLVNGETTLDRALRHRSVRLGLRTLAGPAQR
ncbi:geranylgeranyl reductase family protein [Nocardioides sp.]|uniref:geranylgeranyl reductase family protein n=1 Tax=Nocardioides sp. TaxID=35761 RepID=UPI0031FE6396